MRRDRDSKISDLQISEMADLYSPGPMGVFLTTIKFSFPRVLGPKMIQFSCRYDCHVLLTMNPSFQGRAGQKMIEKSGRNSWSHEFDPLNDTQIAPPFRQLDSKRVAGC